MEPLESATRWHQWTVRGDDDALARVIATLDAALPAGWRRLTGDDLKPYGALVRAGAVWYALDPTPTVSGVALSVEHVRVGELRGGRVLVSFPSQPPATRTVFPPPWDQVTRFLDEGIVPAARSVPGLSILVPDVGDLFLGDLPPNVASRLRAFSQATRKILPLDRDEADRWRTFVVEAYRARAVLDAARFVGWLVHEGWTRGDATDLSRLFVDQCLLLARYAEEVAAA